MHSEIRSTFELLVSGRSLDMRETGDPGTLALKDSTLLSLFWASLGLPDLIVLPTACDPVAIEFPDGKGREAWKITLSLRQILQPS